MSVEPQHARGARPWERRWKPGAAVAIYVLVACIYFVLPIKDRFGSVVLGTSIFPHDTVLNAGILEWGRQALPSSSRHVFDWTAGYPLDNALAVTENLLGWQPPYSLLRWAGVSVAFAYNVLLVLSLPLSAIGAALLARRLGVGAEGAFLSGLIFAFVPFHLSHLLHLQTMAVCWAPFAVYFLDRFLDRGKARDLACLAGSFVLCTLSGLYIGIFLALALPVYAAASLAVHRVPLEPRRLGALAAAGLVSGAALWPVLSHYLEFSRAHGYRHSVERLMHFSVDLLAVLKVPAWVAMWSHSGYPGLSSNFNAAFPGFVALALFVCALRAVWPSSGAALSTEERRAALLLLIVGAVFFLLSLGPRLSLLEAPVRGARWIPLPGRIFEWASAIRWPMRALFFTFLCGAILAGLGFTVITRSWRPGWRLAACAVAGALLFAEYHPERRYAAGSVTLPDPLALSEAYVFLASEADRGGVVELPAADETGYRAPMLIKSAYGSAGHLRRVVGFHGQHLPALNRSLLEAAEKLPDPAALELLRRHGCSRLVVHRAWLRDPARMEITTAQLRASGLPVLWDSPEAVVFSLR